MEESQRLWTKVTIVCLNLRTSIDSRTFFPCFNYGGYRDRKNQCIRRPTNVPGTVAKI
jgi:hypothetical protein